jgi:hypothetical protein
MQLGGGLQLAQLLGRHKSIPGGGGGGGALWGALLISCPCVTAAAAGW